MCSRYKSGFRFSCCRWLSCSWAWVGNPSSWSGLNASPGLRVSEFFFCLFQLFWGLRTNDHAHALSAVSISKFVARSTWQPVPLLFSVSVRCAELSCSLLSPSLWLIKGLTDRLGLALRLLLIAKLSAVVKRCRFTFPPSCTYSMNVCVYVAGQECLFVCVCVCAMRVEHFQYVILFC